jgi:hypothetical protein
MRVDADGNLEQDKLGKGRGGAGVAGDVLITFGDLGFIRAFSTNVGEAEEKSVGRRDERYYCVSSGELIAFEVVLGDVADRQY